MLAPPPALRHPDFRRLWTSMLCSGIAMQMAQVAIGWQVYSIRHNAFDLGLIGLAEFVPVPLLALPAGQLADRLPRVGVVIVTSLGDAVVAALLLVVTLRGAHELWQFVALAALTGAIGALGSPARRSLTPELVPAELLTGALALRSIAGQAATIGGPALGGFLFAVQPEAVYAAAAAMLVLSALVLLPVTRPELPPTARAPRRCRRSSPASASSAATPVILGAITLDLFAVLFGGAVALLPLFAKSILHTGPFGLGVLRSMVAVGALIAGIRLARRPLGGRAGRTLLLVVGTFGVEHGRVRALTVVLAVGARARRERVRRHVLDEHPLDDGRARDAERLLGRVNAVENVFIGASNELGAFESGAAAALLGAMPAVVAGGVLTIVLALVWPRVFPRSQGRPARTCET